MNFEAQRASWLIEHFVWLHENLPHYPAPSRNWIVLPTNEHFPFRNTKNHNYALKLIERVKEYMGISDWACELVPERDVQHEMNSALLSSGVLGESENQSVAGTFETDGAHNVIITYNTVELTNPVSLIATLAHELSHYLLAKVPQEPPCTWEAEEELTDLTAVVSGFGVFLCNSAFQFNQYNDGHFQGWSSKSLGYLSESELSFCLAAYGIKHSLPIELVGSHLEANAREVFLLAWDDIQDNHQWMNEIYRV